MFATLDLCFRSGRLFLSLGRSEVDLVFDLFPFGISGNGVIPFFGAEILQAVIDGEIIGGAILFLDKDGETLYIGRIFLDPVHHRKGDGLSLMKMVETHYSGIKKIKLDTPLWNVRTNAFYTKLGYCEVNRDEEFAYYQKECE